MSDALPGAKDFAKGKWRAGGKGRYRKHVGHQHEGHGAAAQGGPAARQEDYTDSDQDRCVQHTVLHAQLNCVPNRSSQRRSIGPLQRVPACQHRRGSHVQARQLPTDPCAPAAWRSRQWGAAVLTTRPAPTSHQKTQAGAGQGQGTMRGSPCHREQVGLSAKLQPHSRQSWHASRC